MKNTVKKLISAILTVLMCLSVFAVSSFNNDAKAAGAVFIIDPGHGGKDPGAISADGSRYEKNDVLRLSLRVGEIVSKFSTVAYTRTTDVYLDLSERSALANKGGHQYLISIHRNSVASTTANGVETIYYSGYSSSSAHAKFAKDVQDRVIAAVPMTNRGVKAQNLHMVREPNMTSCLIEVGFMKNDNDHVLFDKYFEEIAQAIAGGMLAQIGIDSTQTHELDGNSYIDMTDDFYARIKHISSGKYFTDTNGDVTLEDPVYDDGEIWHFLKQSGGAYLIGNIETHRFWEVQNTSYANGTSIIAGEMSYATNQQFYIYYINDKFYFMAKGGDKTVDISSSQNVQLYGESIGSAGTAAETARAFEIEMISIYDGTKNSDLGNEFTATIKNINSGKYLTAEGEVVIGRNESGADAQKWKFTRNANGTYVITNVADGTAITVPAATLDFSNQRATLTAPNGKKNQTFFIIQKDGASYIKIAYAKEALDMGAYTFNINLHKTGNADAQFAAQQYEITLVSDEPETELIIKNSSDYEKDGTELHKVTDKQTVSEVLSNFNNKMAEVWDAEGNGLESNEAVGTGCTVNLIVDGVKLDSLTVVIFGDVTGDGLVNATDYLRIKNNILKTLEIEGLFETAADVDRSGAIDSTDLLRVKSYFLGTYNIYS